MIFFFRRETGRDKGLQYKEKNKPDKVSDLTKPRDFCIFRLRL
jgi:hypothetical protein